MDYREGGECKIKVDGSWTRKTASHEKTTGTRECCIGTQVSGDDRNVRVGSESMEMMTMRFVLLFPKKDR